MCLPLGVQVSEVSKAMLGQSSTVSSSGSLHAVGLVFEKEGRCSTFHLQSRGLFFLLELLTVLIIPPLISFFLCVLSVETSQSHSHIRGLYGTKKRMVSRCECFSLES